MTNTHRTRWSIVAAVLFNVVLAAQARCPPTPENDRHLEFGETRFAVEEGCRQTFTQDEQFFLAGIAQSLRATCKLPHDPDDRALIEQLAKAATLSLDLRKRQEPHHGSVPARRDRASAFAAGRSMMEDIPCQGPESALLARGIVIFLKRTSGRSRFVTGCVELYAQRYGEKECRCIADAVRPVIPDVDRRFFDRAVIKEGIHESPRVAVTLMLSCGVPEY